MTSYCIAGRWHKLKPCMRVNARKMSVSPAFAVWAVLGAGGEWDWAGVTDQALPDQVMRHS